MFRTEQPIETVVIKRQGAQHNQNGPLHECWRPQQWWSCPTCLLLQKSEVLREKNSLQNPASLYRTSHFKYIRLVCNWVSINYHHFNVETHWERCLNVKGLEQNPDWGAGCTANQSSCWDEHWLYRLSDDSPGGKHKRTWRSVSGESTRQQPRNEAPADLFLSEANKAVQENQLSSPDSSDERFLFLCWIKI